MIVLPTLSRICNKYDFDGYDSKSHYVQYYGNGVRGLVEKRRGEGLLLEIEVRVKDRTTFTRFARFINELNDNLEEVMREAEEILSAP